MTLRLFVLMSLLSFLFEGCANNDGVTQMSVEQFAEKIGGHEVQLVDVCTAEEYNRIHLDGSVNIDMQQGDFIEQVKAKYSTAEPIYIYCRSGGRGQVAATMLAKEGFRVVNLKGGILAWQEAKQNTK